MKSVLVKIPAKRAVCESHRGAETIATADHQYLARLDYSGHPQF